MNRASIDLGSNTCLLLILGEQNQVLHDEARIVRLGEKVAATQMLQPEAMTRAKACLRDYRETCKKHGIESQNVVAVATAQARDSKNSDVFFGRIREDLGFQFRVLSGAEEAKATFSGALLPGMNAKETAVIDIGGMSTELTTESSGKSLPLGAVRISEMFFKHDPVSDEEFWAAEDYIDTHLAGMLDWKAKSTSNVKEFVAVAGTATGIAALHLAMEKFDSKKIDGTRLSRGDVHRWVEELKWRTIAERTQMVGMEEKRADVLLAGALIFWRVMELLDFPEVKISCRGLRFGVLQNLQHR